jgi:hypothetical protein
MDETNDSAGYAALIDKIRTGAAAQLRTQKDRATDRIGSVVEVARISTRRSRSTSTMRLVRWNASPIG